MWVVRHQDATVSVLDAVSTHRAIGGIGHLVSWCPSSRDFSDPAYGSNWTARGDKVAGPAPTGLLAYDATVEGDTVVVSPATTIRPFAQPGQGRGFDCLGPAPVDQDENFGTTERHRISAQPGFSVEEALRQRSGEVVLLRDAAVVLVGDRPATLCVGQTLTFSVPPRCDGAEITDAATIGEGSWAVGRGSFVARVASDGTVSDLAGVEDVRFDVDPTRPQLTPADLAERAAAEPLPEGVLLEGTTADGARWQVTLGGSDGTLPCLTVEAPRGDPASSCFEGSIDGQTPDPHPALLLDDERVSRFVFGSAPEETTAVMVELADDVVAFAAVEHRTLTAGAVNGKRYYAVELPDAGTSVLARYLERDGTALSGRRVRNAPDAPFELLVTNQSYGDPDVVLTIRVDGTVIADREFPVEGQHTVAHFALDLAPGEHRIEIEADDGSTVTETFTVPPDASFYGILFYWGPDAEEGPPLDLTLGDEPFAIG